MIPKEDKENAPLDSIAEHLMQMKSGIIAGHIMRMKIDSVHLRRIAIKGYYSSYVSREKFDHIMTFCNRFDDAFSKLYTKIIADESK